MKAIRYILVLIIFASVFICITAAKPDSIRSKARYYYMMGAEKEAEGKDDEAFELYRRAALIDPDYTEAGYSFGTMKMRLGSDSIDINDLSVVLKDLRKFVDKYPEDYFESRYYAYLASNLMDPEESVDVYARIANTFPEKTDVLLELAQAYMITDSLEKALETLGRFEKIEGKSTDVTLRKITYLLEAKDSLRALEEAKALVAYNPRNPSYKVLEGHVYEYMKQPQAALDSYQEALRIDPLDPNTMMALAAHYNLVGDSVQYDDMVYRALLSEEMDLSGKIELSTEYISRLLTDNSAKERGDHLFAVLRDQYPHEPEVLDLAARYAATKEDWNQAQEEISYAIDLRPENAAYWGQLMVYQISDDKPGEAVKTFNRSKDKTTPTESMEYVLISAYSLDGKYDDAIEKSTELIHRRIPGLPVTDSIADLKLLQKNSMEQLLFVSDLLCGIGDSYNLKKDTLTAFKVYDNSLLLNPDNSLTLNNYAYYLSLRGEDLDRAEQMSRKSLDIDADNPTFLDTYAWIQFQKRNYKEAKKYQQAAIEKTPAKDVSAELYSHYGDILFMLGELDEAVDNWKKALELDPDNQLLMKKVRHRTFFYD